MADKSADIEPLSENVMQPILQSFITTSIEATTVPSIQNEGTTEHQQEPQATTTQTNKQSALQLPSASGVTLLQLRSRDRDANDVSMIDDFSEALSSTLKACEALQESCKKEGREKFEDCMASGGDSSHEEFTEYKVKYEKLVELKNHMKEVFECRLLELEKENIDLRVKERLSEKAHEIEVCEIRSERNKEVKELKDTICDKTEQCELLEQHLQKVQSTKVKQLEKLQESYETKHREVEILRTRLAEKEKSLDQLGSTIKEMETEISQLRETNKRQSLIAQKQQHTKKQLQRCQQIEDMVSHLPQVTDRKEMLRLTAEIEKQATEMKASSMNKRSTSWRE